MKIKEIPIHKIEDPKYIARTDGSPESVEDLVRSIKQVGIIEPLIVREKGDGFELIAGHRRLMAAAALELGVVPCRIVKSSDEEAEVLKLHENLYRKDLNPVEEARFYAHLIKAFSWTENQVAERVGVSIATVSKRLNILAYPDDIKEALMVGMINTSVASQLAQIADDKTRGKYLAMTIKGGATGRTVESWKEDWLREEERKRGEYKPPIDTTTPAAAAPGQRDCFLCGLEITPDELNIVSVHQGCLAQFKEAMGGKEEQQQGGGEKGQ